MWEIVAKVESLGITYTNNKRVAFLRMNATIVW